MKMLAANFLKAFCHVANTFLTIFIFIFIMRLILAWAGSDYTFELIGFLTESGVNFAGKILHLPMVKYDIRPIIVIAVLLFLRFFIIGAISNLHIKIEEPELPRRMF